MHIICAPSGIVDIDRPRQGISDMAKAGFKNILLDLAMYCPPANLETVGQEAVNTGFQAQAGVKTSGCQSLTSMENQLKLLLQNAREAELAFSIARAPYCKRDTKRTDLRELLSKLAQESIQICGRVSCKYLIVRPLTAGLTGAACNMWEANRTFYLNLAEVASEQGVVILLENQCQDMNGHLIRGVCANQEEAIRWVDSLNQAAGEERFGFCMDVGAYSLCGQSMGEIVRLLGSRIKAVILRDCGGQQEVSMLPFTAVHGGQPRTEWLGLIRGLREIGFDGELILDMADTAAVFSPLLRPQLLALGQSVTEYFKWQIGIENTLKKYSSIVLFGAGNMCRNYMKCYGEKYPPLFTCDNNSSLWGSLFCGLEVRPPESLVHLPGDCAIFICNIYYREIEHQLREMEITNPIEFFNDEYMPSFYFDRLRREESIR